ncbi:MAG: nitrate reductase cytochrome c-type subunit [Kofleriaceae bacterium]
MTRARRGLHLWFAAAAATGAVGLVAGVEGSRRVVDQPIADTAAVPDAVPTEARSYRDLRNRAFGPNAGLAEAWWRTVAPPTDEAPRPTTPADRAAALAQRAARRAFEGAPPVIPHEVDQLAAPACLACHEHGVAIGGRIAPPMSHPAHASCLQCHVVADDPRPGAVTPPAPATTFVGLRPSGGGTRAWAGAPPTIPHSTWMRDECASCHGPRGRLGLQTPHPGQVSCRQCHASSAVADQRAPVPRSP